MHLSLLEHADFQAAQDRDNGHGNQIEKVKRSTKWQPSVARVVKVNWDVATFTIN